MRQPMRIRIPVFLLVAAGLVAAQTPQDEDFHVYAEAPRLLLTRQRQRLLERERERHSVRWEQVAALVEENATLPEPGFAYALYYRTSKNQTVGRKAVEWALGNTTDLRQMALVYDWCAPLLSKPQGDQLAAKIQKALAKPPSNIREQSARVLGIVAIADRLPDQGEALLRDVVLRWWRGSITPGLVSGKAPIPRNQTYFLVEMLHVIQDNLKIDLRESAPAYFRQFVLDHLAGHYPAVFPAAENDYRIPVYIRDGDPDPEEAALSRAAGLAMVAYDNNAQPNQFLQGWLMQDQFIMRGGLGFTYEFLWANPYQPGLSYFHVPLIFHDANTGHIFARTSWDDDAEWIGYFDGRLQVFRNGQIQTLKKGASAPPVRVGDAVVMSAPAGERIQVPVDSEALFLLGLEPDTAYEVEIDDQELEELETDTGGTLVISVAAGIRAGARIRKSPPLAATR